MPTDQPANDQPVMNTEALPDLDDVTWDINPNFVDAAGAQQEAIDNQNNTRIEWTPIQTAPAPFTPQMPNPIGMTEDMAREFEQQTQRREELERQLRALGTLPPQNTQLGGIWAQDAGNTIREPVPRVNPVPRGSLRAELVDLFAALGVTRGTPLNNTTLVSLVIDYLEAVLEDARNHHARAQERIMDAGVRTAPTPNVTTEVPRRPILHQRPENPVLTEPVGGGIQLPPMTEAQIEAARREIAANADRVIRGEQL